MIGHHHHYCYRQGVRMKVPGVSPDEALRAVERVHSPEYVAEIKALSQRGGGFIDHDTCASASGVPVWKKEPHAPRFLIIVLIRTK